MDNQFEPLNSQNLAEILGLTIKNDDVNKVVTFLCMLSAYTENSQFNVSFNAPSSTGKSYIPLQVSTLFPPEDLIKLSSCSPTAFFHEHGTIDKKTNSITVDLARKIIIFLDQPNNALLERLRALLSHDEKQIESKITDKNERGGNRTKTVIIEGFPSVFFCSAGLSIDEHEGTRFVLLSPETDQEKLREAILQRIRKESNELEYKEWLENDPARSHLKSRIKAIRDEKICHIVIPETQVIQQYFLDSKPKLKPRHQRDIGRLLAITKTFALLNLWNRQRNGNTVYAALEDIEEAAKLWEKISESQEHNLSPYTYNLYKEIIIPAWQEKNKDSYDSKMGISNKEIMKKYKEVHDTLLAQWQLRQQILPMLETAGLITREPDERDKRQILVTPAIDESENNSEIRSGTTNQDNEFTQEVANALKGINPEYA